MQMRMWVLCTLTAACSLVSTTYAEEYGDEFHREYTRHAIEQMPTDPPHGCDATSERFTEYALMLEAFYNVSRECWASVADTIAGTLRSFPPEIRPHFEAVDASLANAFLRTGRSELAVETLLTGIQDIERMSERLDPYIGRAADHRTVMSLDDICLMQLDAVQIYFATQLYLSVVERLEYEAISLPDGVSLTECKDFLSERHDTYDGVMKDLNFGGD